jgi:hypothetical protein
VPRHPGSAAAKPQPGRSGQNAFSDYDPMLFRADEMRLAHLNVRNWRVDDHTPEYARHPEPEYSGR